MRRAGGVAPRRLAGRTQEDRLQSGYTPSAAVFSDGNLLPDDLADDVRERLDPRRTSARISALPWPKPAMPGRPAISYAVIRVRCRRLNIRRKVGLGR